MTEQLGYRVIQKLSGFEIRDYPKHVLVTTMELGSMAASGNSAFRRLANYIFGSNEKGQSIAMTAPVLQRPTQGGFLTSFVMPNQMDIENLPGTKDTSLKFETRDAVRMAAVTFSGMATTALFEAKAKRLIHLLEAGKIQVAGDAIFARYNGPWTPSFLRRNEVLIPLSN